MKMSNGSGSVYKLSDTKRRRPWVACVSTGYNSHGKQKRVIIGYYFTQLEARIALSDYNKHPTTKLDITLTDLYKEWFSIHCKDLSRSAERGYEIAWQHFKPIETLKVKDIRTAQLQNIIDNAHGTRKINNGEPEDYQLSYSSLHKIRLLASLLLDYAVQNDIISTNYAQFTKLNKKQTHSRDAFSDVEIKRIEQIAVNDHATAAILVMIYTGFRIDEFLSLTSFSYDRENQTLIGGSKTDAGKNRIVPIHEKIRSYIELWVSQNGDTIFCRDDGKRYSTDYFRKKIYYPALERIGIRRLEPHCTRHTFATILHKANVSTKDIQSLMGHSDYAVTANIYTHQDVDGLRKAIAAL